MTDAWSGYSGIKDEGYTREIFNQNKITLEDEMLPHLHTIISLLKWWLLGTHQGGIQKKILQAYLEEYAFRFNRRNFAKRGLLFYQLLDNAVQVAPSAYDDLIRVDQPQSNV